MNYKLIINNGTKQFSPVVSDGVEWHTVRHGAAGKLIFDMVRDNSCLPQEGDMVTLSADGKNVFCGYIFGRQWHKDGLVSVTAYDQLRYFTNKDTYIYSGKTAAQVVKMLAADFGLKTAKLPDTGYVIPSRVEDNKTLFDITANAISLTHQNTGKLFVLYDDFGTITLKNSADMAVKDNGGYLVLDENSAEDFEYVCDINSTFNKIKLVRENKKLGRREVFTAADSENIRRFGTLQYYGKLTAGENGRSKADTLLKLYNTKSRALKITGARGNLNVRAGVMVGVRLADYGISTAEFMLVESVRHFFSENEHTMTLTLSGGKLNG